MKKTIFKRGDVISNLDKKDIRLISGIKGESYTYIMLTDITFKDVFGRIFSVEKGSDGSQPIEIVDRHFAIYEL